MKQTGDLFTRMRVHRHGWRRSALGPKYLSGRNADDSNQVEDVTRGSMARWSWRRVAVGRASA